MNSAGRLHDYMPLLVLDWGANIPSLSDNFVYEDSVV